ncbi:Ba164.1 [Baboon cytomegalovirus]|nr:Ba164.1 [Baboon cytomegalovirus]
MELPTLVATILAGIILLMIIIAICCAQPWKNRYSRYLNPPFLVFKKRSGARRLEEDQDFNFEDTVLILEPTSPQPMPQ